MGCEKPDVEFSRMCYALVAERLPRLKGKKQTFDETNLAHVLDLFAQLFFSVEDGLFEEHGIILPVEVSIMFEIFDHFASRFHTNNYEYSVPWFNALIRAASRPRRPTLRELDQACQYADSEVRATNRESRSSATNKSSYSSARSSKPEPQANINRNNFFAGKPPYGKCAICQSPNHWWKSCPNLPATGPPPNSRYARSSAPYFSYNNAPNVPQTVFTGPISPTQATGTKFNRADCCAVFNHLQLNVR